MAERHVSNMNKTRLAFRSSNEKGFTLLESVCVLFLVTSLFSLFPLAVKTFGTAGEAFRPEEDEEWNLFLMQLRKEIRVSSSCQAAQNTLKLNEAGRTVTYEPYRNSLRRRVDGEGHQIVLQNVRSIQFAATGNGVKVSAVYPNGAEKTAEMTFLSRHALFGQTEGNAR